MTEFLQTHGLDIFTTLLGLLYILLEYRASVWLWLVGIIMPALDIVLYWQHGVYGDSIMAVYYMFAAIYGWIAWKFLKDKHTSRSVEISRMPKKSYLPVVVFFFAAWAIVYYVLVTYTNSTIPLRDSFTNALSIVAMWALSKKYIEQWLFWIVVDAISFYLYILKGIPFKALLYGLYVGIAIAGYYKWKRSIKEDGLV